MPRLVAARPGAVATVADLGYFAYQLQFAATMWGSTHCFSFVYFHAAANPFFFRADGASVDLRPYASLALLRIPVDFADNPEDMNKVVLAANDSDTEDVALTRTGEAFSLFRNNTRIKAANVEAVAEDAKSLVKIAWSIRAWMLDGMKDAKQWDLLGARIVGIP